MFFKVIRAQLDFYKQELYELERQNQNLTELFEQGYETINRKKYIVSLIKTAVFYAAAAAALVFTAKSSDILHPAVRPGPFFSVLLLLLLRMRSAR